MTEQSASPIGTVAQEAARLIEDMATMARSGYTRGSGSSRHAGEAAQEPVWPNQPDDADPEQDRGQRGSEATDSEAQGSGPTRGPAAGVCSHCGADRSDAAGGGRSSDCTFCPLCRGIGLLRSVRPETVDLLADLAMSVAASLREVALRSRASDRTSSAGSTSGGPVDPDRAPVQDIPVDDESEG